MVVANVPVRQWKGLVDFRSGGAGVLQHRSHQSNFRSSIDCGVSELVVRVAFWHGKEYVHIGFGDAGISQLLPFEESAGPIFEIEGAWQIGSWWCFMVTGSLWVLR
jgi:hypothetical protein